MTGFPNRHELAQSIYERLTNDEDARVCREISDEACRVVPGNFSLILLTSFLTKLGDAIVSPKTVLAWLASSLGAPAATLALLVPIRESGSLIPQLVIGGMVRGLAVRKWVWVVGAGAQGLAVLGMAWTALRLEGGAAGASLLVWLVLFSLSRGLCSVASKDVLGKTIPKGRRGQLTGWSASAAGIVSLGIGFVFVGGLVNGGDTDVLAGLLLLATGLWLVAAGLFGLIREQPGATDGGGNALRQSLASLALLGTDAPFRRFVIARSLLMCSALSAPYYVALAQSRQDSGGWLLGAFLLASGAASLVSAPVWGRFADVSSRKVMFAAACIAGGVGALVWLLAVSDAALLHGDWMLPVAFFVLSVAHSGVRVGRKTYVVDLASGNRRTDYVAVSNTVIGVLLLAIGVLGSIAAGIGTAGMIGLLAAMGMAGALATLTLREA